ncbi:hypothetical protein CFC21_031308, partial [Triticum aestivum]
PLLNGNFEYPPNRSQMNGTRVTGAHAIPYWKATGPVEYVESGTDRPGEGMVLVVPEGAHAVRLGSGASVRQQLSVTRGARYSVTFSAARTCGQSERLRLSVVTLVVHHGDDGGAEDPACGPLVDAFAIKTLHPAAQAAGGNLLRNGGFEEGPYVVPGSTCGVLVPPMDEGALSPLPGWVVMSYSKAAKYVDAARHAVPGGSRAVELVAGVEAALVQEVDTVPGSACRMEFSVGDAGDGCVACGPELQPMRVVAAATGAQGAATVEYHSRGTGGHARGALAFTAEGSRTRVVLYSSSYHTMSDGSGSLCGPVVDDVSLVCA